VRGVSILGLGAPFQKQRNAVFLSGNAANPSNYLGTANARQAIGNVQVNGIISTINADSDSEMLKACSKALPARSVPVRELDRQPRPH
jgi:hypothetical protein